MKSTIHEFQKSKLKTMSKNLKKSVLVLAVAVATIFSSCSKSDPTPAATTPVLGTGNITATIAGSAFQSSIVANISMQSNTVSILAGDATGRSLNISVIGINAAPVAGTYKLYENSSNYSGTAVVVTGPNQTYASAGCDANLPQTGFTPTGTITFTTLSAAKIEGTFQFNCANINTCSDVKSVTAGTFSKTF